MNGKLEIGKEFTGKCLTVTDYHVNAFAGLTMDFNPLHVDKEYADRTRFRGRIAHGLLSLSISLGLISELIHGYFLYGFNKVRFLSPVRPGDTVCSHLRVDSKNEKGEFTLYYCTLTLKRNESTVLISEMIIGEERNNHDDSKISTGTEN
ncbi:MAG: MaoC family dehydratase [Candidatus Thermoplasmatota archaeon]|jgi:acyl dehydratase|nr:MaoC family dehydratase [Candidatus Thermoplasmatota archaeon]